MSDDDNNEIDYCVRCNAELGDHDPGMEICFEIADQYVGIARNGPDLICGKRASVFDAKEGRFTDELRHCNACQEQRVTEEMYRISKQLKLWRMYDHLRGCTGLYQVDPEEGDFHILCTDCLDFYQNGADPDYFKRRAEQVLRERTTKRHKTQ